MIYQDILAKIKSNEIKANTLLPTEAELMQIYQVSRDTIRKSLNLLLNNGYIQKTQGRGSMVLDIKRISFPVSGVTSFKEIKKNLKENVNTLVNVFAIEPMSESLNKELGFDSKYVYHIERVREFDGQKVILDIDYLNPDVIKNLELKHAKDSLFEYIEKELKLKISFARKEITVVKATEEEKRILDLDGFDLLVCIKSYTYLEDATPFQYTISKHRPDKFRFVDFARRTQL